MTPPRRSFPPRFRDALRGTGAPDIVRAADARPPQAADYKRAVRTLERKRRILARAAAASAAGEPFPAYYERSTYVSFRLDGLDVSEAEVRDALAHRAAARACRTCSSRRIRNHAAILRHIELLLRRGQPAGGRDVIRWYTSVACGLSGGRIDGQTPGRLDQIVSAMNSPQLRLWPAVRDVAAAHVRLLNDPFVPGFNGILARLLLRYHLGRCGLPPVLFDEQHDPPRVGDVSAFLPRLLDLLDESYDWITKRA